jgi:hypothetical protein
MNILPIGTRIKFTRNISNRELFPDDPDEFVDITGTIKEFVPSYGPFCDFYVVSVDINAEMSNYYITATVSTKDSSIVVLE